MASAFGHAAFAIGCAVISSKPIKKPFIIILGIFSSIMPDCDVIAFTFGIPYDHIWGHRGMTHSIFFALVWAIICALIYRRFASEMTKKNFLRLCSFLFICTVSHGVFDALTTGGMGIAFFAPFSDERYFLPWRIIRVSPLSIDSFFSHRAWKILGSEAIWIGLPSLLLIIIGVFRSKMK